jgi:lipopolysaccharide export system permease protein
MGVIASSTDSMRKNISFLYILGQILPTFLLGIVVFVFILLMFQFLKITDIILVHNVQITKVLELLLNISIGFLPIILPMSLLFAVLLTYSRLSADSEIVAFKALGYSPMVLAAPAIFFSLVISLVSAQTLFELGPRARLKVDSLLGQIGNQKIISTIQEGTFSENFFDLVLYTNLIDKDKKKLYDLFIYDKRNKKNPVAIIAKEGEIFTESNTENQSAEILLTNGNIYRLGEASHTKVKFATYSLNISSPVISRKSEKDADAFTLNQIDDLLKDTGLSETQRIEFSSEYHGRWAIAISCLLFGFLGASVGSQTNRRSSSSSGFILSVICIISYWILYVVATTLSKKMIAPPFVLIWIPNTIFLFVTIWAWRRHLQES